MEEGYERRGSSPAREGGDYTEGAQWRREHEKGRRRWVGVLDLTGMTVMGRGGWEIGGRLERNSAVIWAKAGAASALYDCGDNISVISRLT